MSDPRAPIDATLWERAFSPGRVALVTGGAGAIGSAVAGGLAGVGARVMVADIHPHRTAAVVEAIRAQGGQIDSFVGDLTEDGALDAAVAATRSALGQVDILVNALGEHLGLAKPFDESVEEDWDRLYRVNLLHVMRACRAVLPEMKHGGWGRIVNFSSVEGIRAMPLGAPYTAFKGAIDSFTKSLAVEVAPFGIRANTIAVDKIRAYQVGFYSLPEEYEGHVPVWIPAGRYGEATDVASLALFLSSELCEWVVGQTVCADGGTLSAGGWYRTPSRWTNSPLLIQYFEHDPDINARRPPGLR